ncbi:phospholipase A2 inhibitor-like [Anopheles albimanus]|uniref:phospholipase A2 inhibitor-like n=1 Tax=Anopheles albimanus TaxID=7167 RepID=UPI0016403F9D|nr:phospholipase A2 inhibitor-like [Anopheles albimanus]
MLRNFSPSNEGTYVYKHIPREMLFVIFNFRDSVIGESALNPYLHDALTIRNSRAVTHLIIPRDCRIVILHIIHTRLRIIETSENIYLRDLTVDHSSLSAIPSSLKKLIGMSDLTISHSPIETLDLALFCDMKLMSKIRIKYTNLRTIRNSTDPSCQLSLDTITLINNKLHTLDFNIFDSCPLLNELDLKINHLQVLSGFMRNHNIDTILLSQNQIHQLNLCQWYTPSLRRLYLDENVLSDLPSCITNISLQNLHLNGNCFTYFDIGWIGMMDSLYGLYISSNRLSSLKTNWPNVSFKLSTIHVRSNNLTHLDLSFVETASLYVDARNNSITSFDVKNTSPNVTTLKMEGNPIDCSWSSRQQKETVKCNFNSSIHEIEASSNSKCNRLS